MSLGEDLTKGISLRARWILPSTI